MGKKKKNDGPVFFEDPLSTVDREALRAAFIEEARKRISEFPDRLEALRQHFRTYSPEDILAITSAYALQTTATDKEVSQKGLAGPRLGQHHIEILQAIALSLPEDQWGQKLTTAREIQKAFDLAEELADGFHLRRNAEMEKISNPEENLVRSMQERLRLHTQIVRNWGYFNDVVDISTKLYQPFDSALKKQFGLTATEIISLFVHMLRTIEARSTDRMMTLKRVFRERKPKAMVRAWYKANPHFDGTADDFIREFGGALQDRSSMMALILSHSDLRLVELMSMNASVLAEETGFDATAIDTVLRRLSMMPGELKDANPEHLFLDNPVWKRPLLRISDDVTLCNLAQAFFGFIHEILGELIAEADSSEALSDRRADFLEKEIEDLVRRALPDAQIVPNFKWAADGKNYETDLIAALGSFVLIIEAKSGMITPPALRGAKDRAKRHVEELIIHPSQQSARLEQLLREAKAGDQAATDQVKSLGFDLTKMENILRISVTLDDFNVLASHEPIFKRAGWMDDDHALAVNMNVADFRCVLDLLTPAPLLFDYLSNRARLQRVHEMFGDELDWLGFYIGTGFNIGQTEGEIGGINITGMSQPVDRYYSARDAGLTSSPPKLRLCKLWQETFDHLARRKFEGWIDCAISLIQSASYDEQKKIEHEYRKICQQIPKVWRTSGHINSVIVTPPTMRDTAVVFYAFPPELADERHGAAENLASVGFEQAHIKKVVVFGRQLSSSKEFPVYTAVFLRPTEPKPAQLIDAV